MSDEARIRALQSEAIRGRVDTTGPTITQGKGFSVVKNAPGDVTVRFDRAWNRPPIVTVGAAGAVPRGVTVQSAAETEMRLRRFDTTSGALIDGVLWFAAEPARVA